MSAGQVTLVPVQVSAGSHLPTSVDARQLAVAGATESIGQVAPVPVQLSATSHGPATARQIVPDCLNPSAEHAALVPEQVSAMSQSPAEARHSLPATASLSAGQSAVTPSQVSSTSHGPAAERHGVPAGWMMPPGAQIPTATSRGASRVSGRLGGTSVGRSSGPSGSATIGSLGPSAGMTCPSARIGGGPSDIGSSEASPPSSSGPTAVSGNLPPPASSGEPLTQVPLVAHSATFSGLVRSTHALTDPIMQTKTKILRIGLLAVMVLSSTSDGTPGFNQSGIMKPLCRRCRESGSLPV